MGYTVCHIIIASGVTGYLFVTSKRVGGYLNRLATMIARVRKTKIIARRDDSTATRESQPGWNFRRTGARNRNRSTITLKIILKRSTVPAEDHPIVRFMPTPIEFATGQANDQMKQTNVIIVRQD